MAQSSNAHRLPGLDGLRAVSILLVVAGHLASAGPRLSIGWLNTLFDHANFGVSIFFTISGLLITWLLLREESAHGAISLKHFYARRGVRILPPAVVYLIVILVASSLRGQVAWKSWLAAMLFCRNVVGSGIPPHFIGDNLRTYGGADTGHFWSLSIEEQFYLIWPLLFYFLRPRGRVPFLVFIVLAVPIWRQLNYRMFGSLNIWRADLSCDNILLGCLIACAVEDHRFRKILSHPLFRSDFTVIICVAVVALSFSSLSAHRPGYIQFTYIPVRSLCAGLIVHRVIRRTARTHSILDRFLNLSVIVLIGQLSYSLYLWQQPFCMPTGMFHGNSKMVNLIASFACAIASLLLVERPAQMLRRRLGSRTAQVGPIPASSIESA